MTIDQVDYVSHGSEVLPFYGSQDAEVYFNQIVL